MINSYPSIYNLGHSAISDLLKGPVIVEEKVDGSQLSFVRVGDELMIRSKGAQVFKENAGMFQKAWDYLEPNKGKIAEGYVYRGEFLSKPKHNILSYERAPENNIIIFDIDNGRENYLSPTEKLGLAEVLGLGTVPVLFEGMITDAEQIRVLLQTDSVLGGQKIEGVVIKPQNYDLFGRDKKVLLGKFVSEAFKEVHAKEWVKTPGNKDILTVLSGTYGTEARWNKAVQHLREAGQIENAPQDIGKIMAEVPADILKECETDIREALFKWAWPQLRRALTKGLPEWYKQSLMDKQFESGAGADPSTLTEPDGVSQDRANSQFESGDRSQSFPVPVLADSLQPQESCSTTEGEARESTVVISHDSRGGEIFPDRLTCERALDI